MARPAGELRELTILNQIAEALNRAPGVEAALDRSLALVADLLGMQTGWIWLLDAGTERFYVAATLNLPPYLQEPVQMTGDEACTCIWEFRHGTLTAKNVDVLECSRLRRAVRHDAAAQTAGLRYHASIPFSFGDTPRGILNLTGPEWRELTSDELALLSTIAYQIGMAVERARLAEESARLARAEERTRLAREIHDTLAQGLTAIGLHLEGALRHVDERPALARERLERALETTRENLEEARRSVTGLRAAPLAGTSLADALGALGRRLTAETGVRVHLASSGDVQRLSLRAEAELYRIAQEALTNVRKHARARSVTVTLRATPRRVRLTVQDDGTGFEPDGTRRDCHGLKGMRERAPAGRAIYGDVIAGQRHHHRGLGPTVIRIGIVDDHPIVRDGLAAVLGDEPDFEVAGAAGSAEEALTLVAWERPDVLLLDLELPGASGIDALPGLTGASPGTRVIVFTAYDTEERVLAAVRAGAHGYLLKGAAAQDIARAIRTVHTGGSHLDSRVAATVLAQLSGARAAGGPLPLSERERQVLRLVASGRANKEIARALAISERTVKFHVTSLLNKLGAENRARAAALAVQRGLL